MDSESCKMGTVNEVLDGSEKDVCGNSVEYIVSVENTNWFYFPVCKDHLDGMKELLENKYQMVESKTVDDFDWRMDFDKHVTKFVVDNINLGDKWHFDPTWDGFPEAHAAITYYDYWPEEEYKTSHIIDVYEEKVVLCNDLKTIKVWRDSSIEENVEKAIEYMSEDRVEES